MRRFFIAILIFILPVIAAAQSYTEPTADLGSWLTLQVNKSLGEKGYSMLRLEHRSVNSMRTTEAFFLVAGAGLSLTPWLKADLGYEYWNVFRDGNRAPIHKAVLTANGTLKREGLVVSLREKFEYAMPEVGKNSFTLRSRLRAQYTIDGYKFRPYAMAEVFTWDKWVRSLYYVGGDLVFDRHNSLEMFYLYHLPNGGTPIHILGLAYYFSF